MYEYELPAPDILHAYLDGELNSTQEVILFRQLADSEELRSVLRELLALRSLVQSDRDDLFLPGSLKKNVLLAVQPEKQSWRLFGSPGWNMRSLGALLCAAIIGSILSIGITTMLDTAPKQAIVMPRAMLGSAGKIAPGPRQATEENHRQKNFAHKSVAALPSQVGAEHKEEQTVVPHTEVQAIRSAMPMIPTGSGVYHHSPAPASAFSIARGRSILSFLPESDPMMIGLHMRGYAAQSYPAPSTSSQSDPWFRNMAIGLSYMVSEHQSIGIEVGQENFAQVFRGVEGGRKIRYEQNPLLFWYGLSYRYTTDPLDRATGIRPYGELFTGATGVGPLGRTTAGIEYMPDRRVTLSLGIEGSLLAYRFQNAWNISRKLGITYEMSLLF